VVASPHLVRLNHADDLVHRDGLPCRLEHLHDRALGDRLGQLRHDDGHRRAQRQAAVQAAPQRGRSCTSRRSRGGAERAQRGAQHLGCLIRGENGARGQHLCEPTTGNLIIRSDIESSRRQKMELQNPRTGTGTANGRGESGSRRFVAVCAASTRTIVSIDLPPNGVRRERVSLTIHEASALGAWPLAPTLRASRPRLLTAGSSRAGSRLSTRTSSPRRATRICL
jgi:hypothetical protein